MAKLEVHKEYSCLNFLKCGFILNQPCLKICPLEIHETRFQNSKGGGQNRFRVQQTRWVFSLGHRKFCLKVLSCEHVPWLSLEVVQQPPQKKITGHGVLCSKGGPQAFPRLIRHRRAWRWTFLMMSFGSSSLSTKKSIRESFSRNNVVQLNLHVKRKKKNGVKPTRSE